MKSIKELYRIGTGPSSSHTMGPRKAAEIFLERHPEAASFKVHYTAVWRNRQGSHDQHCHYRSTAADSTGRDYLGA